MRFDAMISNLVLIFRNSEEKKLDVSDRLKVSFGQFRQFSSYCSEFSVVGDLDT